MEPPEETVSEPSRVARAMSRALLAVSCIAAVAGAGLMAGGSLVLGMAVGGVFALSSLFAASHLSAAHFVSGEGVGVRYFGRRGTPRSWKTIKRLVLNVVDEDERAAIVIGASGELHIESRSTGFRPLVARLLREAEAHDIEIVYAVGYLNGQVGTEGNPRDWQTYLGGASLPVAKLVRRKRPSRPRDE